MLVEDDPPTRDALGRIFTRRGWVVDAASTVVEALDGLAREPDFVILDLMLPDGDGTTVLRAIRQAGRPVPVAVTTGCVDRDRLDDVRSLAPDALLFKPVQLRDLDDAMNRRP